MVAAVLSLLFEPKDQYVGKGGLYNSLYQSNIVVDKVEISKNKASVYLTGTMLSGGTCDDPRIMAQLTQTVLQFEDIKEVTFFVNNKEYTGSQKE
ncbi:MAG: hypothetical protein ACD_22C00189G0007 [uncultured bacterium]|nr:MAG: hypothetical protein ACD_22C00189G0007 [uncultured bacterium]